MAYNKQLAGRIREAFAGLDNVEEKDMMGGFVIMYNGKMCVGVSKEELMCRIDPGMMETVLEKNGCRQMAFGGRSMKGYVLIDPEEIKRKKELMYWIGLAIAFNPTAKASRKK